MRRKILALVVLAAVGVGAVAVSVGAIGAQPAAANDYLTTEAAIGNVTDQVAATGTLAAASTYGLVFGEAPYLVTADAQAPASDQTWPVTELMVKPGDHVTKGQVLATADSAEIRREIKRATADVNTANLQWKIAREQLADARDAEDNDQIRQALLQVYSTQKQASQANEQRSTLRAALLAATLRSPIDGTVTEVNVAKGFDAPSGAAIVVASDDMTVTTNVVESDLTNVAVGQTASITLDAIDATTDGTVTAISPVSTDDSSGIVSYPVTVTLKDPPGKARDGMSADVSITVASANDVVTVPASALQGNEGNYAVMTLGADGTPQRVPVQVGLVTNASAEIKSGLDAGTAVVIGTTSDLVGTGQQDGGPGGFGGGGVGIPGGVVRRIDGGGPITQGGNP
jgi:macrolide-specific efflux system membrane fusion protein